MNINDVMESLGSTFADWSTVLINNRFIRRTSQISQEISWIGNDTPRVEQYPVMYDDVIRLFDNNIYSFQVIEDGSLFQLYYLFDSRGRNLQRASLTFYCTAPTDVFVQNEELGSSSNTDDLEIVDEVSLGGYTNFPVSWMRIDYAPRQARGVLHHECHMHLSGFPNTRLVVAGLPTPYQFVEFVMAACYPIQYEQHRLNDRWIYRDNGDIDRVNTYCFPWSDSPIFRQITHIRIPSNQSISIVRP
jgi:hypothetical protein